MASKTKKIDKEKNEKIDIKTDSEISKENLKLANMLVKKINKLSGIKVASKLSEDDVATIPGWISIGNEVADIVISNVVHGGIPLGRITSLSGNPGCVTEDTNIEVIVEKTTESKIIKIKEIDDLLKNGKIVKVKGLNEKFNQITDYIDKGVIKTYEVLLQDNYSSIKVSNDHKFFTEVGWLKTRQLKPHTNSILCEDGKYRKVISIDYIGLHKIVDVTVENEHAYFGNKMYNHNSGKSLICAHLIKNIQKQGGIAVYFDTESATSSAFWERLGVDTNNMILVEEEIIENIYSYIDEIILSIREQFSDKKILIIIDSMTSASSKHDIEAKNHELGGYSTHKARVNSRSLKQIANNIKRQKVALVVTSQLRQKLGASLFEDPYVESSGGDALKFYSSLSLRLRSSGKIKEKQDGIEQVIGVKGNLNVTKSRFGTLYNSTKFNIYFSSGVENEGSWLEELKKYKLVTGGAGGYFKITITDPDTGEIIADDYKFRSDSGFMEMLKEHPEFKIPILKMIASKLIVKIRNVNDIEKEKLLFEKNYSSVMEEKKIKAMTVSDSVSGKIDSDKNDKSDDNQKSDDEQLQEGNDDKTEN